MSLTTKTPPRSKFPEASQQVVVTRGTDTASLLLEAMNMWMLNLFKKTGFAAPVLMVTIISIAGNVALLSLWSTLFLVKQIMLMLHTGV